MDRNELEIESENEGDGDGETVSQTKIISENASNLRACRVCLEANGDTVILPCRHAQICYSCAEKSATTNDLRNCPICREEVEQYLQLFL